MNHTEKVMMALVRSALWQRPLERELLGEPVAWGEVMMCAERQTVTALAASALVRLADEEGGSSALPSDDFIGRCVQAKFMAMRSNQQLNDVLKKVVGRLNEAGVPSVLLKGQGVAQCYPHPLLRTPGDIDLFVGYDAVERAIAALQPITDEGSVERRPMMKHDNLACQGVEVELHRQVANRTALSADRRMHEYEQQLLNPQKAATVTIDGQAVRVPQPAFNVPFIFYHLQAHFFTEGVGLRQFCDWAMLLHRCHQETNAQELERFLRHTRLLRPWRIFGNVLVDHLGLPAAEFPLYQPHHRLGRMVLGTVLRYGNFGHAGLRDFERDKPRGWFTHRAYTFTRHMERYLQFMLLSPRTSLFLMRRFLLSGFSRLT